VLRPKVPLVLLIVVAAATVGTLPDAKADSPKTSNERTRCPVGKTAFNGACVEQGQCCEPSVCPAGTVLEFFDKPTCVPCKDVATQSSASYCARQEADRMDYELNSAYRALTRDFPSERSSLKSAESAWIAFRDKFCAAFSGTYRGGTMEAELFSQCLVAETRRQTERLGDLRKMWSQGRAVPSGQ
jgi:uncharacterized protein YecT (DUF1311 family)